MPKTYQGLSEDQVILLQKEYGLNEIKDQVKRTPLIILLGQVKSNIILYLLVLASILSFLVGKNITGFAVLGVITLITTVGFIQEYRAEEAVAALKSLILPITHAIRSGNRVEIPSTELVPGDIVLLGIGEKIPADCVVLEQHDLRVNESALTGESKEIKKTELIDETQAGDENRIFMGTYVINGRCIAKVTHTGMNTKLGHIAHLISSTEKTLPLQNKVNKIAKYMVSVAIISSLFTGFLILLRSNEINREVVSNALVLMIALAVSAFPEGFPVVLTTTLALGAKKMANKNAIVNRMSIIETLGETTVICSDKTGTITKGEMTVKFIFTGNNLYEVGGVGYVAHGDITENDTKVDIGNNSSLNTLIKAAVSCNDAIIERTGEDAEYKNKGTPTEAALLILGAKIGVFRENLNEERISEYPFNSNRKMMSVLVKENGGYYVYAKGAPEVLIDKCSRFYSENDIEELNEDIRSRFSSFQYEMSKAAYRTLAIAYKPLSEPQRNYEENDFILLGLVSMEDPPREEVADALETAKNAGIRIIMISGDHKDTVQAIASQLNMQADVLEGKDIDQTTDEELEVLVKKYGLFARVKPEHKLRIVKALKKTGEIVAMTGDGVNDAPALKEAHIGIAMGKNGTDVSRSVADLTLKDDNFATILSAITEGRTIFNNIRKFVTYQLSCNIAEILILVLGVLLAPVFGWQTPILASIQILFMNLVTDNLPALTLSFNPTSKDIMQESPRRNSQLLNKTLIKLILSTGMIMTTLTLLSYHFSVSVLGESFEFAKTTALLTLILLEIGAAFSFRSFRKTTLNRSPFVNRYLAGASLISIAATIIIIYTGLNTIFETNPIGLKGILTALIITIGAVLFFDVTKVLNNKNKVYVCETK